MKATEMLHNLGQSIWLDNITRSLLTGGTLRHYVEELVRDWIDVKSDDLRQRNHSKQR